MRMLGKSSMRMLLLILFSVLKCVHIATRETNMDESLAIIPDPKQIQNDQQGPGEGKTKRAVGPDDLTNLNWVAGIPVPMFTSVSPPESIRTKKLFFGTKTGQITETESENNPSFTIRTKPLKTPLPTYKIVVKDQKERDTGNLSPSSNGSSPDWKNNSVIYANVVPTYSEEQQQQQQQRQQQQLQQQQQQQQHSKKNDVNHSLSETIAAKVDDVIAKSRVVPVVITVDDDEEEEEEEDDEDEDSVHDKPNCSYTCLVGMALKASTNGCLPVNAIYLYIEREFPYFLNAPDGWKNSVRHNLSLNPIFCKVNRDGWTGKKGYLWKVCSDKQDLVDKEISRFLHSTGKKLNKFTIPLKGVSKHKQQRSKKLKRLSLLSSTPVVCSRCTRILSPVPHESSTSSEDSTAQLATVEEIQKYSSEMQEEVALSDLQVKSKVTATQAAFDTNKSPSKYVGVKSPTNDPNQVAREVFGLAGSNHPNGFYPPMGYGGPFLPLYPQQSQYGMPFEIDNNTSSGSSNASPMAPGGMNAQFLPHFPQYAMPVPIRYVFSGQYPSSMYNLPNSTGAGGSGGGDTTITNEALQNSTEAVTQPQMHAPMYCVRVLSSSDKMERDDNVVTEACGNSTHPRKHQYHSGNDSNVSDLNSPLKRMKVMDSNQREENESVSAYFADVSTNSTCSDDGKTEGHEATVSNIMSLLSKHQFSNISDLEKRSLDEIVGKSDLSVLLSNGFSSKETSAGEIMTPGGQQGHDADPKPPPPLPPNEAPDDQCEVVLRDYSTQQNANSNNSYYLPSLDSLLDMGDDTILTIKTAMNLEIQGVVEVATDDPSHNQE